MSQKLKRVLEAWQDRGFCVARVWSPLLPTPHEVYFGVAPLHYGLRGLLHCCLDSGGYFGIHLCLLGFEGGAKIMRFGQMSKRVDESVETSGRVDEAAESEELREGDVWWSVKMPDESAAYADDPDEKRPPSRVKLWRRDAGAYPDLWRASAFDEATGKLDEDMNATRVHRRADVGATLFRGENEAWEAYLGEAPDARSMAAELEAKADYLEVLGVEVAKRRATTLRRLAASLRGV